MSDLETVALFQRFPQLRGRLPWALLGQWPTPVQRHELIASTGAGAAREVWVKREDLSSDAYGGNKVRTVEAHAGLAKALGKTRLWSTGAYGSNHATATLIHAPRAGLLSGALLFKQPATETAKANLRAMAATAGTIKSMWSPASLPFAILRERWRGDYVMTPGGATPVGAMGHVSAALELAQQVEDQLLPAPSRIYLAVGSTCTSAGLLVGLHIAAHLGIGFGAGKAPIPQLRPVRVTPWPFTATAAVVAMARWTAANTERLLGAPGIVDKRSLAAHVKVVGGFLGKGYGYPTDSGRRAIAAMAQAQGPQLDVVYTGKAVAAMLAARKDVGEPVLFWATKSTAALPKPTPNDIAGLPGAMQSWLEKPD